MRWEGRVDHTPLQLVLRREGQDCAQVPSDLPKYQACWEGRLEPLVPNALTLGRTDEKGGLYPEGSIKQKLTFWEAVAQPLGHPPPPEHQSAPLRQDGVQ